MSTKLATALLVLSGTIASQVTVAQTSTCAALETTEALKLVQSPAKLIAGSAVRCEQSPTEMTIYYAILDQGEIRHCQSVNSGPGICTRGQEQVWNGGWTWPWSR